MVNMRLALGHYVAGQYAQHAFQRELCDKRGGWVTQLRTVCHFLTRPKRILRRLPLAGLVDVGNSLHFQGAFFGILAADTPNPIKDCC